MQDQQNNIDPAELQRQERIRKANEQALVADIAKLLPSYSHVEILGALSLIMADVLIRIQSSSVEVPMTVCENIDVRARFTIEPLNPIEQAADPAAPEVKPAEEGDGDGRVSE